MKKVMTSSLVPGMITAEDVYSFDDKLILPKGFTLTDKAISKLEFYSVLQVRIESQAPAMVAPEPSVEITTYSDRIRNSPEFIEFKETFENEIPKYKDMMQNIASGNEPVNTEALLSFSNQLLTIESGNGYVNIFDMLHNMRQYDDLTFVHSINVSLICNVFGRWLKLNEDDIQTLTLCGMLHDIGKLAIPDKIIKKPSKLTDDEYTIVKKHTLEGYKILRGANVPDCVRNSALMHHERADGTGYPLGLAGNQVEPFARIVAIADVYDALTSARIYRGPLCPFKAIELFESEGLQRYDAQYIMTFLENIVNTYMMHTVRLSDGRMGEIVFINKAFLSRPTINCNGKFIDLSAIPSLTIEAIL